MKSIPLPAGTLIPTLGLGTWRLGESSARRATEVAAVRSAIEIGYRLIDTAEMYGEGAAEEVVGQAIAEALRAGDVHRDELFVVSKVYPHNASRRGTLQACERSRRRLGLDRIDLYLLHWRGEHPLADTVAAMHALVDAGRIAHWGVSNFDVDDMEELMAAGPGCAMNQVYFSLGERGPEFSLLPWLRAHGIPLMAYSPIDQAALSRHGVLEAIGRRLGISAAQVALAWLLRADGVVAIPKAAQKAHLHDNLAAAELSLDTAALTAIDHSFAPPRCRSALAMN